MNKFWNKKNEKSASDEVPSSRIPRPDKGSRRSNMGPWNIVEELNTIQILQKQVNDLLDQKKYALLTIAKKDMVIEKLERVIRDMSLQGM